MKTRTWSWGRYVQTCSNVHTHTQAYYFGSGNRKHLVESKRKKTYQGTESKIQLGELP